MCLRKSPDSLHRKARYWRENINHRNAGHPKFRRVTSSANMMIKQIPVHNERLPKNSSRGKDSNWVVLAFGFRDLSTPHRKRMNNKR